MRVASLAAFILVGVLMAWVTRAAGLSAAVGYALAFAVALVVAWVIERFLLPRRKRPRV